MYRILVLDGDIVSAKATRLVLQRAGYEVACAQTAVAGLSLLSQFKPDVVFIDLQPPEKSGLEVLRLIRQCDASTRCILIMRFGHEQDRDEAMIAGAFDCIEQPMTATLLLTVVHNAVSRRGAEKERVASDESHAMARWADVVVRAVHSPKDMPTLQEWGRAVAVSKGGLRNWCYTARLSPRRSPQFMRILRAVIRQQNSSLAAEDLLDIVDRRTLTKLLKLGGGTSTDLPNGVVQFLEGQQIIRNSKAIAAIRAALYLGGVVRDRPRPYSQSTPATNQVSDRSARLVSS
jgi:DNA-binding response OmpR family regulator